MSKSDERAKAKPHPIGFTDQMWEMINEYARRDNRTATNFIVRATVEKINRMMEEENANKPSD